MRSVALVVAGLIWAAAAGAALAAPGPGGGTAGAKRPDVSLPLEGEGVITQPDWIEKPSGDDFTTYFPRVAQLLAISGHTLMRCEVATDGALVNCLVTQEQPTGLGFGDAALKISQFFRMRPMSVDGAPVAGGRINIPITFAAPPPADVPPAPADDPPPSPKALDLARRIAAISYGPDQMQTRADQARRQIVSQLFGASLTEQEQAGIDDYAQALADSGPAWVEALARRYARAFTEPQLEQIAAFVESPTGAAWIALGERTDAETTADNVRIQRGLFEDARNRFCSKYGCPTLAAPPAQHPSLPAPAAASPARK